MTGKKRNYTIDQIRTLFANSKCKTDVDFSDALGQIVEIKNKNDKPFTIADIRQQPELSSFKFYKNNIEDKNFEYVCDLKAIPIEFIDNTQWKNERIVAEFKSNSLENKFKTHLGVTYILTCILDSDKKERIIKFGSSRTTMEKRLGSYNCGVINNWRTASTTNIKILQSLIACRKGTTFRLYCSFCGIKCSFELWGIESTEFSNSRELAFEDILVKEFKKQYKHLPLVNVQTNATTV